MTEEAVDAVAEPSQRLVARLVDTLIVGVPLATVATEPYSTQTVLAPVGFAAVFLVYESVQLVFWGRTVGKRLTGIKVVSADGGRLRASPALARAAVYALPPAARPVPVLNVLAAIFLLVDAALVFDRPYRQTLHDRAAGTVVVRA
jgi:uncharacterized RDD family membrane protein YckC